MTVSTNVPRERWNQPSRERTPYSAAHALYVPAKRLQFVSGAGAKSGAVNFSTVLLGRGAHVVAAMQRLAATYGGATKVLL